MNMDKRIEFSAGEIDQGTIVKYVPASEIQDEINLGDLVRNLAREWRFMAIILLVGTFGSIAYASLSTKIYLVEARLRAPTLHELGDFNRQNLIEINPGKAFTRFTENVLAPENHHQTLLKSGLLQEFAQDAELTDLEISRDIYNSFSLDVIKHDYYQLAKSEKAPLKEITISMKSGRPELAQRFLQALIEESEDNAVRSFTEDFENVKQNRIEVIKDEMSALARAEKLTREAEIARLDRKARQERENNIIQIKEALEIARALNIVKPVTWDDMRPERQPVQVTNEIGNNDSNVPLYFRGTELLQAELSLLKTRQDDRPFIAGIADLENEIIKAKNDPRIVSLKARTNDLPHIEKFASLQRQLSLLQEQPDRFENTRPMLIVAISVVVSGFLALLLALILASVRSGDQQKAEA
jgi:LPS O-antigen subunit length determinant protein (WzzB/FepE family)